LRPFLSVGLSSLLVGSLVLSGCTSSPPPKAVKKPTVASTSSTPVVVKPKPVLFKANGTPADLASVVRSVYFGGAVRSTPLARKALRERKGAKRAPGPVVVSGSVASWQGVPIAVVTKGRDVTLAVKAPRWTVVGGWWPSMGVTKPALGGARRILMVGSDARPGQSVNKSRADSLHIVGVDGHGGGGVLGIPRDSYVSLASGGKGKINSALTFGGPQGLQRTVASATGVPLQGYVITGFDGFKKAINGIGGLPMNVPVTVVGAGASVVIKKGPNKLTGRAALAYGRQRHSVAGGDFGRSSNQGLLIMAAGAFAKLVGPARLPGILHAAAPNVTTNLTAEQVLTFAAGVYVTSLRKVHNRVATGGFGMTSDGQSIVQLDAGARLLFADIRDGNLK
jgi:LCP family protein required for cell wall assembly